METEVEIRGSIFRVSRLLTIFLVINYPIRILRTRATNISSRAILRQQQQTKRNCYKNPHVSFQLASNWLRIIQLRGNVVSRISLGTQDNFLSTIFTRDDRPLLNYP